MICVRQLSLKHGNRSIVSNVNFTVSAGSVTTIIGANGAGKSTLLNAVTGQHRPSQGGVYYGSLNVRKLSAQAQAIRRACLPQQLQPAFALKCSDLLEFGTYGVYDRLTSKERVSICEEIAQRLDVLGFAERLIQTLSGGERQRIYLAKALIQLEAGRRFTDGPQALILDEPTTGLDIAQQARLLREVMILAKEKQVAVLCVLHDLNLAAQLSNQIVLLGKGKTLAVGTPKEVLTEARLHQALGIDFLVQQHPQTKTPLLTPLHPTTSTHVNDSQCFATNQISQPQYTVPA